MDEINCIIVGAGPSGLLAALILGRAGIRTTILEKASKDKIFSDVGSGFRVCETALTIFRSLGLGDRIEEEYQEYSAIHFVTMSGKLVRDHKLPSMKAMSKSSKCHKARYQSLGKVVLRSSIQSMLISEIEKLSCVEIHTGIDVHRYSERDDSKITLRAKNIADGTISTHICDVLLACDGIHSAIRSFMYSDDNDYLNFCGCVTWWGVAECLPDSSLFNYLKEQELQRDLKLIIGLGTKNIPGRFEAGITPSQKHPNGFNLAWTMTKGSKEQYFFHNDESDLGKRGGVSGTASKTNALAAVGSKFNLARDIVESTPPEKVIECGLFDRERLDLPYTNGRVALIGDAAHPQTPAMGQGFNTAITDAFCVTNRLIFELNKEIKDESTSEKITQALLKYDNEKRRKEINRLVIKARELSLASVKSSRLDTLFSKWYFQFVSGKKLNKDIDSSDNSNRRCLAEIKKESWKLSRGNTSI